MKEPSWGVIGQIIGDTKATLFGPNIGKCKYEAHILLTDDVLVSARSKSPRKAIMKCYIAMLKESEVV